MHRLPNFEFAIVGATNVAPPADRLCVPELIDGTVVLENRAQLGFTADSWVQPWHYDASDTRHSSHQGYDLRGGVDEAHRPYDWPNPGDVILVQVEGAIRRWTWTPSVLT